jgi:hypothetical protein
MPKAGFIVTRVSFLILGASLLGVAMLAAPAVGQTCAPPSGKCFAVAVSPASVTAGVSASFAFTITNEASTQTLGSAQISAPAGFVITSAPGAASFTPSSALFLNLNLAAGAHTTPPLMVTATVSCNRSTSTYQWGMEAKQSNEFNGPGNDFVLDTANSTLSGTLTGCTFQPCPPKMDCSTSASSTTTSVTITTSAPLPSGDSLVAGMEPINSSFNYNCPTYTAQAFSDVFEFAVFDATGAPQPTLLTVTARFNKSLVDSSGHPGASSWQICYASTTSFPGASQQNVTIGGTPGYFTGLLPNCPNTNPQGSAPCVQMRNKNNAGDVIVTFLASGDPYGHG